MISAKRKNEIGCYPIVEIKMLLRPPENDRFLFKVVNIVVQYEDFSTYTRSKTVSAWTSDIFVIKRTAMQLLSEFIGSQKIRLVGVGVSRLRERDMR
jgi:DNA polymerase IV (archaeal DinB-like DNA polymerase)